jgi:hypothetical protein
MSRSEEKEKESNVILSDVILSPNSKLKPIKEIQKKNFKEIAEHLADAALQGYSFPDSISEKLDNLQAVYKEHQENAVVKESLKKAITDYVNTELLKPFEALLENEIKLEHWHSSFVRFLCGKLNIKISEEPLVQAAIRDGKIYWRVMNGATCLYERHKTPWDKLNFSNNETWFMPWPMFRELKDGGKRAGSVEITKKRFLAYFKDDKKDKQVEEIWDELKKLGILNERNRLSHSWRTLTNVSIELDKKGTYTNGQINSALNAIANDDKNKEVIKEIPNAYIFRPERSLKTWKGGKITNETPKTENYVVKRWDVGIYSDLTLHSNKDDGLDLDHIPSGDAMKNVFEKTKKFAELKTLKKSLKELKEKLTKAQESTRTTRSQDQCENTDEESEPEKSDSEKSEQDSESEKVEEIEEQIQKIEIEKEALEEKKEHWWTIALPNKMHKQGETFQERSSTQAKANGEQPAFFREVNAYFLMLLARPEDFIKDPQDYKKVYLQAVGAFRYLYRSQVKAVKNIEGTHKIGSSPQVFFQDAGVRKKIDAMFCQKMREFMVGSESPKLFPFVKRKLF